MKTSTLTLQNNNELAWRMILALCATVLVLSLSESALANTDDPFSDSLCRIYDVFTGTIAKVVATIGVIIVGIGALMGKISMTIVVATVLALIIIFSAGQIITWIAGDQNAAEVCATVTTTT